MGENTAIEWATHTWNPWIGCSRVHVGCQHCYAEAMAGRLGVTWGPDGTRLRTSEQYWKQPLKWERAAAKTGTRPRIFPSLCDPFEDGQGVVTDRFGRRLWRDEEGVIFAEPASRSAGKLLETGYATPCTLYDLRCDLFALIDRTPHLDWLLLSKRPENVLRMWGNRFVREDEYEEIAESGVNLALRPNVWLIYSASDQATLEAGLSHLVACRYLVPVLGLSLEPLVGPVDLGQAVLRTPCGYYCDEAVGHVDHRWPDWVIIGGESGPHARPCNVEWIHSIVGQCKAAGVPCFVKQLGARPCDGDLRKKHGANYVSPKEGRICTSDTHWIESGEWLNLRDPKGGDPTEWPEDLRVQQFPHGG